MPQNTSKRARQKTPKAPIPRPAPRRIAHVDALFVLLLAAIALVAFWPGMRGAFVYDDTIQILENPYLRTSGFSWRLLTTDVWGFKADKGTGWSDYWRPLFSLWLFLNAKLFGLSEPFGWHLANLVLHLGVAALAYGLMLSIGILRLPAMLVALLFLCHPSHVESVTWISGSPNMLLAGPLLGALWLAIANARSPRPWKQTLALCLYALALLAKEPAVLFGLVVLALPSSVLQKSREASMTLSRRLYVAAPYFALAAAYLVVRFLFLGRVQGVVQHDWTPATIAVTLPGVLLFYFRQAFWPSPVSPSYSLHMLRPSEATLLNFGLPLIMCVAIGLFFLWLARRSSVAAIGVTLAGTALIPTMNLRSFVVDQIVHDRYLYLPILGLLMAVVPLVWTTIEKRVPAGVPRRLAFAAVAVVPLSLLLLQTRAYSQAWTTDLSLWEWAARVSPESAFTQHQLASHLRESGRLAEARAAADRSIAILPTTFGYQQRARIAYIEHRYADAIADLEKVLPGAELPVYEQLSAALEADGRLNEAIEVLRRGRAAHPYLTCRVTANITIALFKAGRQDEMLPELEAARPHVAREYGLESRRLLLMLGTRYAELGRFADARLAIEEFLELVQGIEDPKTNEARARAQAMLRSLPAT